MGNYNTQYESYYSKLNARKAYNNYNRYPYTNSSKSKSIFSIEFIAKRLMRDLTGVFILLLIILFCKIFINPYTAKVYSYSKQVISTSYDYQSSFDKVKAIKFSEIDDYTINAIESLKAKITGRQTLKEQIKESYVNPVTSNILAPYGESMDSKSKVKKVNNGIDFDTAMHTDVSAVFNAKVLQSGENKVWGKFILLGHGSGIETKYSNLDEILVEEQDVISKGQIIARTGNSGIDNLSKLHFELLYMGQNKNPMEYINIKDSYGFHNQEVTLK